MVTQPLKNMQGRRRNRGIIYRESFGLCLVRVVEGERCVLLVENRATYWFSDFINDRLSKKILASNAYLEECFNKMTEFEKSLIASRDFDRMWEHVFCTLEAANTRSRYYPKYVNGRKFVEGLWKYKGELLTRLCSNGIYGHLPLGLPRGKPDHVAGVKETHAETASRELMEETGITPDKYRILFNERVLHDRYVEDSWGYDHHYIMAEMKEGTFNVPMEKKNVSKEIGRYKFYSLAALGDIVAVHPRLRLVRNWVSNSVVNASVVNASVVNASVVNASVVNASVVNASVVKGKYVPPARRNRVS